MLLILNPEIEEVNSGSIDLKTVSGDIDGANFTTSGNLVVSVVSGDAEFQGVIAKRLEISMVSGDLKLSQANFDELVHIGTVSGDVDASDLKVPSIEFRTVSGDFKGEEVYCKTVALKSVSGDFKIFNSNKNHEIEVVSKKSLSGDVTIK